MLLVVGVLFVFGLSGRLLSHPWNVTPLTAVALFAASYMGFRQSLFLTFAIMLVSDLCIGFYQWEVMFAVYLSFALASYIGSVWNTQKTVWSIVGVSIGSSLLFFIITNYAVWQFTPLYTHTLIGLQEAYIMAIPFFKNSCIGDLMYTGFLFGAYEYVSLLVHSKARTARSM